MQLVYILLISIVVYYLVTRLFENYSTQEDFDPSLVPVSSIVTLAKVAQKLVDGGGTLTNPGNLRVTGDLTVNGAVNLRVNNFINDITGKPRYLLNINNPSAYGANKPSYDNFYYTAPAPAPTSTVIPSQSHRFMRGDLATPADIVCGDIDCNKITCYNVSADASGARVNTNTIVSSAKTLTLYESYANTKATLSCYDVICRNIAASGTIDTQGGLSVNSNLAESINCGNINNNNHRFLFGKEGPYIDTAGGNSMYLTSPGKEFYFHEGYGRSGDINVNISGNLKVSNNLTITPFGGNDWQYSFYGPHARDSSDNRSLSTSGGGWANINNPATATNNGGVSWDGGDGVLTSRWSRWTCPYSGLWTVAWWMGAAQNNFAIINETQAILVSSNYGIFTMPLYTGNTLYVTLFSRTSSNGNVDISGHGYWRLKCIQKFN